MEDSKTALEACENAIKSGDYVSALALTERILKENPDHRDALYFKAVCLRYLEKFPDALATLAHLQKVAPAFGRCYQEIGHNRERLHQAHEAVAAYKQAVRYNSALVASWHKLEALSKDLKLGDENQLARQQLQYLQAIPPALVSVASMLSEGKLYKAEILCRKFLQKHPHHPEAMRLLANVGAKLNVLDDAEFLLESCVELHPGLTQARFDYVNVLHKRQKYKQALEQASSLYQAHPDNPAFATSYANENLAVGNFDAALELYEKIIEKKPQNENTWLMKGHALKTIGKQDEAIAAYRQAYTLRPEFGDAWWSLANLKTYRFGDDEVATMQATEQHAHIDSIDHLHLCFALGRCWEDREDYQRAFTYYARGNAIKKSQSDYSAERTEREFSQQREQANAGLFANGEAGHSAPDPVFIVGLPRAGSTLLEQILASHSQVDGTLELPNILAMAHRLNGRKRIDDDPKYPAVLHDMDSEALTRLGQQYLDDTRVYRQGAPFFTDKMPNNFRHIALILKILPNAKIIDARRHPMACCFSGFKQLFAEGQEFTYSLEDIARYYRGYVELMAHWDQVAPGKILRVYHENVVSDTEDEVKRILQFCGLNFEEQCLEFHKTRRAVRTASSEQVRQPIYRSGLEQWRRFEPHLAPLKNILEDIIDSYPAAPEIYETE